MEKWGGRERPTGRYAKDRCVWEEARFCVAHKGEGRGDGKSLGTKAPSLEEATFT